MFSEFLRIVEESKYEAIPTAISINAKVRIN